MGFAAVSCNSRISALVSVSTVHLPTVLSRATVKSLRKFAASTWKCNYHLRRKTLDVAAAVRNAAVALRVARPKPLEVASTSQPQKTHQSRKACIEIDE